MRTVLIAGLMTIGLGLAGMSATVAAPASGSVIANAAASGTLVDQARWYRRHHRHHGRCWRWRCW
jgi:hypothetical protein